MDSASEAQIHEGIKFHKELQYASYMIHTRGEKKHLETDQRKLSKDNTNKRLYKENGGKLP